MKRGHSAKGVFAAPCGSGYSYTQQQNQNPWGKLSMNRRELLKAAAALPLAQRVLADPAFAQAAWPAHNVTMIVPFPAGGQADLAARPAAQALEKILGKPFVVDNRAGGAGGTTGNAPAPPAGPGRATFPMPRPPRAGVP